MLHCGWGRSRPLRSGQWTPSLSLNAATGCRRFGRETQNRDCLCVGLSMRLGTATGCSPISPRQTGHCLQGPSQTDFFVHGCFWHRHSDPNCKMGRRQPRSRQEYWLPKLERNVARDRENLETLKALGWDCLIVWEWQIKPGEQLQNTLTSFL